MGVFDISCLFS